MATAVTFRAKAEAEAQAASLTITKPTGTTDNDVLVAIVACYEGGTKAEPPTPPSGWTAIDTYDSSTQAAGVWWKRASSEGASYTWTAIAATDYMIGTIVAYHHVSSAADPIDVYSGENAESSTTDVTGLTVTTTADNNLVLHVSYSYYDDNALSITPPADFVERQDYCGTKREGSSYWHIGISEYDMASAGATGDKVATFSEAGSHRTWMVALKNAPAQTITLDAIMDSTVTFYEPLVDTEDSTVKIVSPIPGTYDTPVSITDTTPEVIWTFGQAQDSYCLTFWDNDNSLIHYSSGWVSSSTQSHTVPAGAALTPGRTYSVALEVIASVDSSWHAPDERAWWHVQDATVAAPTLTAEPDCTTANSVTLVWAAPAITDGDTLTYDLKLYIDGSFSLAVDDLTATSYPLGRMSAGTYTWTVRATDEHGMESSWASTDEFTVTLSGASPTVTLFSWGPSISPIVTSWSCHDLDGDAQDAYEVDIASDAGFTNIVEASGTVASTDSYLVQAARDAGTWYRRVKVRTNTTDWSSYATDSVTVVEPTVQSSDLVLYRRHSDGVLSKLWTPVSGVNISRRLDGPSSFAFQVNNFFPIPPTPYLVWNMDEMTGDQSHDIIGGYDGTASDPDFSGVGYWRGQGDTDYIEKTSVGLTMADAFTCAFICKLATIGSGDIVLSLASPADDVNGHRVEETDTGKLRITTLATSNASSAALTVGAGWVCLILWHDGTDLYLYKMGAGTSTTVTAKDPTGTTALRLNGWAGATGLSGPTDAYYGPLVVYQSALSSANRTKVYRALQHMMLHRGVEVA